MRAIAILLFVCRVANADPTDTVGVDDTNYGPTINAFAFGYFSGLTLGGSNYVFAGLLSQGQVAKVRADRLAHPDADDFGRIAGFTTLLVGGWQWYRRRQRRMDSE
jgi:hypothetical protein